MYPAELLKSFQNLSGNCELDITFYTESIDMYFQLPE